MANYFESMLLPEERVGLRYIPTVSEFVEWLEKTYPGNPALTDTVTTLNYKEFCDRIARRRAFINSLGMKKGAKIAIFDRNSMDAIELYLAIASAGYVFVIFPAQLPEPAVIGSCRKFDVEAIFVRDEFMPLVKNLQGVQVHPASSIADEKAPVTPVDPEQPAAIFFTGGTTGTPKGAVLPHRALMRGCYNGRFHPGPVIGCQKTIALLPLSHVFGLIFSVTSNFYNGNLVVTAEDMKATIGKLPMIQPTMLVLVPGLCDILAGLVKMYGPQFLGGKLRTIISGAANVPPRLVTVFEALGVQFLFGYGLTEGANLTTGNKDTHDLPTSVGKIYEPQVGKIVDGELLLKGDNLFTGYYNDPVNTAAAFTEDGWFRTGDLARIDDQGYVYILGRIKNIIILPNGENVSPEELEEPFYADFGVRDAMVKEDTVGDVPCIAVEILPNMPFFDGKSPEEIKAYFDALVAKVNSGLPTTHRIAKMTIRTEDFKRTGSLKVARNQ